MIAESPLLIQRIRKLRRLKLKLEQENAILRDNGRQIWQRCKAAEEELSRKGRGRFVFLNKKIFCAMKRISELEGRCDELITDYDRLLAAYDRFTPYKACIKCKQEKHIELFEKDPRNQSGRGSKCKKCKYGEIKSWRQKRIVRILVNNGIS